MGANLKGLANTLKNKIYQAKKKGIDTSFIPKGYSKLPDSQKLNLINRLGQQITGKNYSYQGINNTITPKIPKVKSVSPRSNLGKYMKKTGINNIDIAKQNLKDIEHYSNYQISLIVFLVFWLLVPVLPLPNVNQYQLFFRQ